jgi:hypothetical protein
MLHPIQDTEPRTVRYMSGDACARSRQRVDEQSSVCSLRTMTYASDTEILRMFAIEKPHPSSQISKTTWRGSSISRNIIVCAEE